MPTISAPDGTSMGPILEPIREAVNLSKDELARRREQQEALVRRQASRRVVRQRARPNAPQRPAAPGVPHPPGMVSPGMSPPQPGHPQPQQMVGAAPQAPSQPTAPQTAPSAAAPGADGLMEVIRQLDTAVGEGTSAKDVANQINLGVMSGVLPAGMISEIIRQDKAETVAGFVEEAQSAGATTLTSPGGRKFLGELYEELKDYADNSESDS